MNGDDGEREKEVSKEGGDDVRRSIELENFMRLMKFGSAAQEVTREANVEVEVDGDGEEEVNLGTYYNIPEVECTRNEAIKEVVTYGVVLDEIMDHTDELSTLDEITTDRENDFNESLVRNLKRVIELTESLEFTKVESWAEPIP